jgi:hypothetical protein
MVVDLEKMHTAPAGNAQVAKRATTMWWWQQGVKMATTTSVEERPWQAGGVEECTRCELGKQPWLPWCLKYHWPRRRGAEMKLPAAAHRKVRDRE